MHVAATTLFCTRSTATQFCALGCSCFTLYAVYCLWVGLHYIASYVCTAAQFCGLGCSCFTLYAVCCLWVGLHYIASYVCTAAWFVLFYIACGTATQFVPVGITAVLYCILCIAVWVVPVSTVVALYYMRCACCTVATCCHKGGSCMLFSCHCHHRGGYRTMLSCMPYSCYLLPHAIQLLLLPQR